MTIKVEKVNVLFIGLGAVACLMGYGVAFGVNHMVAGGIFVGIVGGFIAGMGVAGIIDDTVEMQRSSR